MSIIACLMALTHNIIFGVVYFVNLFKNPSFMPVQVKIAAIISLILICLMIPLFVTSFKCVRKNEGEKLEEIAKTSLSILYIDLYSCNAFIFNECR